MLHDHITIFYDHIIILHEHITILPYYMIISQHYMIISQYYMVTSQNSMIISQYSVIISLYHAVKSWDHRTKAKPIDTKRRFKPPPANREPSEGKHSAPSSKSAHKSQQENVWFQEESRPSSKIMGNPSRESCVCSPATLSTEGLFNNTRIKLVVLWCCRK